MRVKRLRFETSIDAGGICNFYTIKDWVEFVRSLS